jgi:adenylosuccinate synthase
MSLWVVVGGQYGSEGKGKTAAFLTLTEQFDICIRCGGPNSGHSFVADDGTTRLVRQLPTGFVSPRPRLLVPAGGLVSPLVLRAEIEMLGLSPSRVGIDRNAMIIDDSDRDTERSLGMRERLSSTLCGVGAAVARRAMRGSDVLLARDAIETHPWLEPFLTDVSAETNRALDQNLKVLVEGTQGFGLSLYHTAEYPKATSRDTTASGFLSEVGISPRRVTEVVVVFRTFPIRVAGEQAGSLSQELTWEMVRAESGYPWEIQEFTSVTNMPRRIGRFNWDLAQKAVDVNRPTRLAITGLDYLGFECYGVTDSSRLADRATRFIGELRTRLGAPVSYASTSPRLEHTFALETQTTNVPGRRLEDGQQQLASKGGPCG